jgi:nicotinamide-nucleotide amidase
VIPNPVGSARGLHFSNDHFHLFAVPGVPAEMKSMMINTVLPWINDKSDKESIVTTWRTTGIMESVLFERLDPVLKNHPEVHIAFLPKFTGVDLRISSDNQSSMDAFLDEAKAIVKKYHFGDEGTELEDALGALLIKTEKTIATAESCTGGLIGDRLTNVSGSSSFYKGGVVAYSNTIKVKTLNVNQSTLDNHGAVSEETALEMARGVRISMDAEIGLSTTGIAGPTGGTDEKPVGLVYVGISIDGYEKVYRFKFTSHRKTNKLMTSQAALNITRIYLLNGS